MYAFKYHRPDTLRKAVSLLGKLEDAKLLAGGHTLLPTMKNRLASPANIIDISGIADLRGITVSGKTVTIGALTTYAEINSSKDLRAVFPALADFTGLIGDPAVRHRGTIGGSISNNDPAADFPAACVALGAVIVTNKRKIAAEDFFTGLFSTALEENEIVTKVIFKAGAKFGYAKFRNPASRYAMVGVAVAKRGGDVRVAVTGSGADGVFRWADAEKKLGEKFSPKSLDGMAHPAKGLNSDLHASAEYRGHLIGVMARRAAGAAAGKRVEPRHEPLTPVVG
jgi:carbon-monoxide dehydrogenase medium subunit